MGDQLHPVERPCDPFAQRRQRLDYRMIGLERLFDGTGNHLLQPVCLERATLAMIGQQRYDTVYATENFLCYAPSLHNVCVKATKNDTRIFDFVHFMHEYSCTIYPLFLWYAYSAQLATENVFPLIDFKSAVRIGYLDLENNGEKTLAWLQKNVAKREEMLRRRNPKMIDPMLEFEQQLKSRGLTPENAYLFMHGHTLMDNVVMILLNSVCEKLRQMSIAKITASKKQGVALKNEMSNYTNSLRSIRDVLLDNENYTKCPLYKRLQRDIEKYIARTIWNMKRSGEIRDDSTWTILRNMRQG